MALPQADRDGLVIIVRDHFSGDAPKQFSIGMDQLRDGIPVGSSQGRDPDRTSFELLRGISLELYGESIAEMQGGIKRVGKRVQYENLVADGAALLQGKRIKRLKANNPVPLAEGDTILLGHYQDGPEYSIEIKKIY